MPIARFETAAKVLRRRVADLSRNRGDRRVGLEQQLPRLRHPDRRQVLEERRVQLAMEEVADVERADEERAGDLRKAEILGVVLVEIRLDEREDVALARLGLAVSSRCSTGGPARARGRGTTARGWSRSTSAPRRSSRAGRRISTPRPSTRRRDGAAPPRRAKKRTTAPIHERSTSGVTPSRSADSAIQFFEGLERAFAVTLPDPAGELLLDARRRRLRRVETGLVVREDDAVSAEDQLALVYAVTASDTERSVRYSPVVHPSEADGGRHGRLRRRPRGTRSLRAGSREFSRAPSWGPSRGEKPTSSGSRW